MYKTCHFLLPGGGTVTVTKCRHRPTGTLIKCEPRDHVQKSYKPLSFIWKPNQTMFDNSLKVSKVIVKADKV